MKIFFIKILNFLQKINLFLAVPIVFLIKIYQKTFSPDHSFLKFKFPNGYCKFYPTCSEYSKKSFEKFGIFGGFPLSVWRVLRCNPWKKDYSIDNVPKSWDEIRKEKEKINTKNKIKT